MLWNKCPQLHFISRWIITVNIGPKYQSDICPEKNRRPVFGPVWSGTICVPKMYVNIL